MTAKSTGPFGLILIALALAACASPVPAAADASEAPPIGVDLGTQFSRSGGALSADHRSPTPETFVADSPVEGTRFEPPVPP